MVITESLYYDHHYKRQESFRRSYSNRVCPMNDYRYEGRYRRSLNYHSRNITSNYYIPIDYSPTRNLVWYYIYENRNKIYRKIRWYRDNGCKDCETDTSITPREYIRLLGGLNILRKYC